MKQNRMLTLVVVSLIVLTLLSVQSASARAAFIPCEGDFIPLGILDITIEECGLSRIPLGGLVQRLHQANLLTLYDAYRTPLKARRAAQA